MMTERGLSVDHTTIYRWVQEYAPELDKCSRPYLKQTNDSWRVDETYVKIRGKRLRVALLQHNPLKNVRFFP
jgi:transposase-like protein